MKHVLIGLCIILAILSCVQCLTLQVEPKTTECFYHDFPDGKNIKVFWSVVRGGLLDVQVQIFYEGTAAAPQRKVLYDKMHFETEEEGIHSFQTIDIGTYAFCFNNEMARFTAKVVHFRVVESTRWGILADRDISKAKPSAMESSARHISEELDLLELHQEYMRSREIRNRETQESTNSRLFWLSLFESIVLVGISSIQAYYIRRLFNTTKRMV